MKKYEKEFVEVKRVPMLHGGECVQVTMVISEGKFSMLERSLEQLNSILAKELLIMLDRAKGN